MTKKQNLVQSNNRRAKRKMKRRNGVVKPSVFSVIKKIGVSPLRIATISFEDINEQ